MTAKEKANTIIGKNINRLLNDNNMNQAELAKALGLSESAVGKWILGKNGPTMGSVQKMSNYFRVNISDILEESPAESLTATKKYLMDRIAKADDKKVDKIKKLMELIDDEEINNWR